MVTCKDWMIYILENNLVNAPLYSDGKLLGFMSTLETAVKFEVGEATVRLWVQLGKLDSVKIGNVTYIPAWSKNPKQKGVE